MIQASSIAPNLPALPDQPSDVAWPTSKWPRADLASVTNEPGVIAALSDQIFDLTPAQGVTYAFLIIKDGKLVNERYDAGANPFYLQYSWSMAKSVTHALTAILAAEGKLDIYAPANVPEWQNDSRRDITVDQLLRMSSGLAFNEDYVDGEVSDVINMLQFDGRHDMGAYAASLPLKQAVGSYWNYSSGTTNIICRILKDIVGGGASGMLQFMNDKLFEPIGIRTATPKFDTSGTFIGSSYLMASPQDFARFGYLYLRGGLWDGQQIVPRDWVDYARSPTFSNDEYCYGAHWWMKPGQPDWFYCSGYDGQRILCVPEKDTVIVRLGRTSEGEVPYIWDRMYEIADRI